MSYLVRLAEVAHIHIGYCKITKCYRARPDKRAQRCSVSSIANVTPRTFEIVQKKSRSGEYKNYLIISVIKNVERASTVRTRASPETSTCVVRNQVRMTFD